MTTNTATNTARPTIDEVLADGKWHSVAHIFNRTGTHPVPELIPGIRAGKYERSIGMGGYPIIRLAAK